VSTDASKAEGKILVYAHLPRRALADPGIKVSNIPISDACWGLNEISTTPGFHRVRVWVWRNPGRHDQYPYGTAVTGIEVAPGQSVELYYSPPLIPYSKGRIGPTPQRRAGVAVLVALGVAVSLVLLLIIVIIADIAPL